MEKKIGKKAKALIITAVVIFAVIVVSIVVKANETYIYSRGLYLLMPKSVTIEVEDKSYEFYARINEDFNAKEQKSAPLEAYEYYCTDPDTGEEILVSGTDNVELNGEYKQVFLSFLIDAKIRLDTIKSVVSKCFAVLIVVAIVALIVVWYKVWAKKEDEAKAKKYKVKNHHKNSN